MAVKAGRLGDVYIATGSGTAMTDEATTLVSGTTYQITNTAKRYWDMTAVFVVKVSAVAVPASNYELVYANGKIVFKAAPGGAVTVTGAYLSVSQLGQCTDWTLNYGPNLVNTEVFGDAWEVKTPTIGRGTASVKRFYFDDYFLTNLRNPLVLALYEDQPAGSRYMMIARLSDNAISNSERGLLEENVSFAVSGWIDYAAA